VNVQVVVPEAFILGSGELHVDMGSAINLVCIIEKVSCANYHHIIIIIAIIKAASAAAAAATDSFMPSTTRTTTTAAATQ